VSTAESSPPPSSTAGIPPGGTPCSSTTAVSSSCPQPAAVRSPLSSGGSPPSNGAAPGPTRCCDTGRPLFTDPLTGQTVCSCQYDLLSYQRLASAGVAAAGAAGIPALSMYSAPYTDGMAAYFPALGADQAPFYTSTVSANYHCWLELCKNYHLQLYCSSTLCMPHHIFYCAFSCYISWTHPGVRCLYSCWPVLSSERAPQNYKPATV
jgi:hypothetical protein